MSDHLGGHNNITHVDLGVLKYFYDEVGCRHMVDVGCGPAGNVFVARDLGYHAIGIDGDKSLLSINRSAKDLIVVTHDYTTGILTPFIQLTNDLVLSTEFLEHVEEKYLDNVFDTFERAGKYVCITHALPHETGGHHHVNCQTEEYWIQKFSDYGFEFLPDVTDKIRTVSTMRRNFMRNTGKVFRKS